MAASRPALVTSRQSSRGTLASPALSTPAINTMALSANLRRHPTRVRIKIRDFGFENSGDRYCGLGTDILKPKHLAHLNKKLGWLQESITYIEAVE